jgi:hypothetical protein
MTFFLLKPKHVALNVHNSKTKEPSVIDYIRPFTLRIFIITGCLF